MGAMADANRVDAEVDSTPLLNELAYPSPQTTHLNIWMQITDMHMMSLYVAMCNQCD